jgi:preprotein translocase subunit SecD
MRRRLLIPLLLIVFAALGGLAATLLTNSSPELGLDLQGGVSVVLQPTEPARSEQLDVALDIIRTRVDALGVAEPDITRQGETIVVQLPGVTNRERVLALVGQTAELRFRPVLQQVPYDQAASASGSTTTTTAPDATTTTTAPTTTSEGALGLSEGEFAGGAQTPTTTTTPPPSTTTTAPAESNVPPLTDPRDDEADAQVTLTDHEDPHEFVYALGPTIATGRVVESASAELDSAGRWQVKLVMRAGSEGIDLFNEAAAQCNPPSQVCPSGQLAIVLDSVVESAPTIQQSNFSRDQIVITGSFTESEAKDLALVLRYGSLPVELERQTVQTVSASLGEDSLHAGILAGLVGLSLVVIYMILYYRALGLVVVVGMGIWAALIYSIISWLGETQGLALTLSGVTGIIVSIGITVDTYVVFFERIKDEVKAGRTLRTSIERAFKRAWRTVLAANTTAFIGAAVLWWLTVGSVRGFAFFLGLSTLLDIVTAWFFTRPVVTYLSRNRVFTEAPFLGVARGLTTAQPGQAAQPVATPAGGGR